MTQLSPHRVFLRLVVAAGGLLVVGFVQAQTRVDAAGEAALALGYPADTTQVDGKKYAAHQPDPQCNNGPFWQGRPSAAFAGCAMFGRKQIAADGCCLAYQKIG